MGSVLTLCNHQDAGGNGITKEQPRLSSCNPVTHFFRRYLSTCELLAECLNIPIFISCLDCRARISMYSNMWLQWLHLFIYRYEPRLWCNPLWVTLGCLGYTIEKGLRVKSKKENARYSGGWVSALTLQPATRWKVKRVESIARIERAER